MQSFFTNQIINDRSLVISLIKKLQKRVKRLYIVMEKISYALGLSLGNNLSSSGIENLDIQKLAKGIQDVLEKNLRVMDQTAFALCKENQLPIIVFNLNQKGNLKKIIMGENIGTIVNH